MDPATFLPPQVPSMDPATNSRQQAVAVSGAGHSDDKAYFKKLEYTINDCKTDLAEQQDMFGSAGDAIMNESAPEKKRGRGEGDSDEPKGVKHFHIGKWRVDEAVQQLGGDYCKWFYANVPQEHRVQEVNSYVAKALEQLHPEQLLTILAMQNIEQIHVLYVMLEENERVKHKQIKK